MGHPESIKAQDAQSPLRKVVRRGPSVGTQSHDDCIVVRQAGPKERLGFFRASAND
jgi:hypothetical protein